MFGKCFSMILSLSAKSEILRLGKNSALWKGIYLSLVKGIIFLSLVPFLINLRLVTVQSYGFHMTFSYLYTVISPHSILMPPSFLRNPLFNSVITSTFMLHVCACTCECAKIWLLRRETRLAPLSPSHLITYRM